MTKHPTHALIVAAALPLVVKHGASVTTSMIARAAGITSSAVFGAFPDKGSLLDACAAEAVRPDEAVAALTRISLSQPLETRLAAAAAVLHSYTVRVHLVADTLPRAHSWPPDEPTKNTGRHARSEADLASLREALTALFEPERDHLRLPPEHLAGVFQSMVLAAALAGPAPMPPTEDLVSLLLWGALSGP
ncbi:TetR/AcrR family transcriptional regulator [Streptomyces avidinii]|uniref:TetR/AcrR family transcriptional regulator n=1 Tax=Streptomyces avidinii TaxID=1895 RepID=UPI00386482B2|nr:TetR/AcrR family transcriptional regulator [Streptomyces avidinii]